MLNTKEAAKIIGVGTQSIRNYINDGLGKDKEKLKSIQVMHGRRMEYRISNSDLNYYKLKYLTVKEVSGVNVVKSVCECNKQQPFEDSTDGMIYCKNCTEDIKQAEFKP